MKVAGLDIGFSTARPSAGIGLFDGRQIKTTHCYGVDVCNLLIGFGRYDIIAIDGPVVPKDYGIAQARPVERLFCRGLFQKRCKPRNVPHRDYWGSSSPRSNVADLLIDALDDPPDTSLFPRVRKGPIVEAFPKAFLGVCLDDNVFATMPPLRRGKMRQPFRNMEGFYGQPNTSASF